jgi:hypothetical protein
LKKNNSFFSTLLLGIFFINFLFPKAGFKIDDLPITIGYLLILFSTIFFLFSFLAHLKKEHFLFFLAWLPFQLFSFFQFVVYPIKELGYFFSFLIHFFFFPFYFYILVQGSFGYLDHKRWVCYLKRSFLFLALFGVFLFFYKIFTGVFLEIPGLTVNFNDLGTLEEEKFIDRGGIYKLISTYGNGNLYGICLLFFYPLYLHEEKKPYFRFLVRVSFILTLSRTVWIGCLFCECLDLLRSFHWKKIGSILFLLVSMGLIDRALSLLMAQDEFAFDPNLGGRATQLETFYTLTLLGHGGFDGIYEMVYLGLLHHFGILGLFAFLFAYLFPIAYTVCFKSISPYQTSLIIGLTCYLFLSLSDGAILLIPTFLLYYFAVILLTTPFSQLQSFKN